MKYKGSEIDLLNLSERFMDYNRGKERTYEKTIYRFLIMYNKVGDYYWFDTNGNIILENWLVEQPEFSNLEEIK